MSKVNFVSEFIAIMRYARDYSLTLRERMLWIALFYAANDRAVYNEHTMIVPAIHKHRKEQTL
ncbi:MAG: hypothetical protein IJZ74_07755 [Clostridia bacterium]|nr:hypothetical protein [Clostridia bacterium]